MRSSMWCEFHVSTYSAAIGIAWAAQREIRRKVEAGHARMQGACKIAHRKALLQSQVHSVEAILDERFFHRQHGALNVVVDVADEVQVAYLCSERIRPLVHLPCYILS